MQCADFFEELEKNIDERIHPFVSHVIYTCLHGTELTHDYIIIYHVLQNVIGICDIWG
jgi:hypothetical protein